MAISLKDISGLIRMYTSLTGSRPDKLFTSYSNIIWLLGVPYDITGVLHTVYGLELKESDSGKTYLI